MNDIINTIMQAISTTNKPKTVTAFFKNGHTANYTYSILEMLKTDPGISSIIDTETGELLYMA